MTNVTVTIDVHALDRPEDICYCNSWLQKKGIPATFLIPTALLDKPHLVPSLKALNNNFHEIGTHAHHHSDQEKFALQHGGPSELDFLRKSFLKFSEFYGFPPKSFRSPTWCYVNRNALEILYDLGYRVDASATPQRLGLFSPYPRQNPWLCTKRKPFFIFRNLLEIPTTCFIFPLGSPTFHTFRKWGSKLFLKMFIAESKLFGNTPINLMLHVDDFVSNAPPIPKHKKHLKDLLPRTPGGIMAKHWIRETDRHKISQMTHELINQLAQYSCYTLSGLYNKLYPHMK